MNMKVTPGRRLILTAFFVMTVASPLSATALTPQATAHPGEGVEVTFSDGVKCNLDAAWPHYSRDHNDVSAAATVTCRGGSATSDLQTIIQGPTKNDHAPVVKVCDATRTTRKIGDDVYFVKHPCHAGRYPGDGLYYSHVRASITHAGETKAAYDFARANTKR